MRREDEIRARLRAATDPPWLAQGDYVVSVPQAEAGWASPAVCRVTEAGTLRDAKLIGHAPADLAYLLDQVEGLVEAQRLDAERAYLAEIMTEQLLEGRAELTAELLAERAAAKEWHEVAIDIGAERDTLRAERDAWRETLAAELAAGRDAKARVVAELRRQERLAVEAQLPSAHWAWAADMVERGGA